MYPLFVNVLLDWLLPPSPEALLLRTVEPALLRTLYTPQSVGQHLALTTYANPIIRAAIKENKFHNNRHATQLLATLLGLWCKENAMPTVIIPIPLSARRQRERGYNQVTVVAKRLCSECPFVSVATDILHRTRHTVPQTSLQRTERKQNVTGVFALKNRDWLHKLTDHHVVILDDVATTGATLSEARATVAPHLPANTRLTSIALAH